MNGAFPISKSFLDEGALASEVESFYGLSSVSCQLISATLRDVYLVNASQGRFVLYVYRHGQNKPVEILAEWQFIEFLHTHHLPVIPALLPNSDEKILVLSAPEGVRFSVLTTYVDDKNLRQRPDLQSIEAYGRIIAQIHTLANGIPGKMDRPDKGWETLVSHSVAAFEAIITVQAEDKAYLRHCASTLHQQMENLPREKALYGMIHGDVIRANALVSDNGQVTVLDFDLCGYGWRVYDVASFLAVIEGAPYQEQLRRAFLSGYQSIRPLTAFEEEMIPVFQAVRIIFDIGVKASNLYHWGSAYLHTYLDQLMDQLKGYMALLEGA